MKYLYLCFLSAMALLWGCDKVATSERLIDVPRATVNRNVLIEEFTGQKCVRCPNAAEELHKLQKQYGADTLIVVSIHAGDLSYVGSPTVRGLETSLGQAYYRHWALEDVPRGIINRSGGAAGVNVWAARVYEEVKKETSLDMSIATNYDAATRTVNGQTRLRALAEDLQGKLQLWLVEDSIETFQLYPNNKTELKYIHQHVFRAAINGDWGSETTLQKGVASTQSFSYRLADDVVAKNAWIVAFVYNDSGVLQVVRQRVMNP